MKINLKQAQLYVHKTKYIHFMNLNVLAESPNLKVQDINIVHLQRDTLQNL